MTKRFGNNAEEEELGGGSGGEGKQSLTWTRLLWPDSVRKCFRNYAGEEAGRKTKSQFDTANLARVNSKAL